MSTEFDNILFDMPKNQSNSIKVIGVGGGGSNAVNHMFTQNINGVDFVICNTDAQALENSPVPNKIQLGANLTSGLGAGANPEIGAQAAKESLSEIQQMLNNQTKMVFITAGMGGGTGTGAAPIIAKIAKEMDILTVGIVTMPFQFEGRMRTKQAQIGIDQLRKNVDSLIVINNNKLREVYGNLGFKAGFSKADEVLSTASKGIAEVITHHYKQNIDLHDAKAVLSNSGTAIMGSAKEEGKNRSKNAIIRALDSPLLNDNKITGANNVLLLIVSGTTEVTLDEIGEINDHIQTEAGHDANIIMGIGEDENLGEAISVTIVATGFAADQQNSITNMEDKKIIHTLEDDQKATYNFNENNIKKAPSFQHNRKVANEQKVVHSLEEDSNEKIPTTDLIPTTECIAKTPVVFEEITSKNISEEDFIIIDAPKKEMIEENNHSENQAELLFDLPLHEFTETKSTNTETSRKELTSKKNIYDIEVFEAEEIIVKKHVLEDFDLKPTITKSSNIGISKENHEDNLEFGFSLKTSKPQGEINQIETHSEEISPLSYTIAELTKKADDRKNKMKSFNHKFNEQLNKNIDEIERQPAYLRNGLDIGKNEPISKKETAIKKDNDDLNITSKNSFLHDKAD